VTTTRVASLYCCNGLSCPRVYLEDPVNWATVSPRRLMTAGLADRLTTAMREGTREPIPGIHMAIDRTLAQDY